MPNEYLISKFKKKKSLYSKNGFSPSEYQNKVNLLGGINLNDNQEDREKRPSFPGMYSSVPGGIADVNIETYVLLSESSDILLAENNNILNS